MEYINAKSVLPQELIEELQRYVQGGYLYIPAAEERHRCWNCPVIRKCCGRGTQRL